MTQRSVVFVHAARPSLEPVMSYFPAAAPELAITNLLDDGVMAMFAAGRMDLAQARLLELVESGVRHYGAEAALLTCSAVTREAMRWIRAASPIPVLKIDEPMAARAVETGARVGMIATFPPTRDVTRQLILDAATAAGREVTIEEEIVPEAIQALLAGDRTTHDRMLMDAARRLKGRGVEVILLAQVSMGPLVEPLGRELDLPVFSSRETSLAALRALLPAR